MSASAFQTAESDVEVTEYAIEYLVPRLESNSFLLSLYIYS